jgi:hypothetical protein
MQNVNNRSVGVSWGLYVAHTTWQKPCGRAIRVGINGDQAGSIAGAESSSALLAAWAGKKAVTAALKKAMVGVDIQ